jgi:DNA-binding transcriptional LysR family regulator
MPVNLPTDLLRSFVTIVDTGSMVRASEHVFLTQPALSLQMKRLSEIIRRPIFNREKGNLKLTLAGEILLTHARTMLELNDRIVADIGGEPNLVARIGMVQDFADAILPTVLSRFKELNRDVRLEIRIGNSAELRELVVAGRLDLALFLGQEGDPDSFATADTLWVGQSRLAQEPTVPLAVMTKPCMFREIALAALEAQDRRYVISVETPSTSALRAAVESGLAVTCRAPAFIGPAVSPIDLGGELLPKVAYCMSVQASANPTVIHLAELLRLNLSGLARIDI